MVSPVLEELASEMVGQATFGKLNVDDNPTTSQQFGIQGIPTIMVFKDGEPVDGLVGAAPKQMIEARIRPYVSGTKGSPYQKAHVLSFDVTYARRAYGLTAWRIFSSAFRRCSS